MPILNLTAGFSLPLYEYLKGKKGGCGTYTEPSPFLLSVGCVPKTLTSEGGGDFQGGNPGDLVIAWRFRRSSVGLRTYSSSKLPDEVAKRTTVEHQESICLEITWGNCLKNNWCLGLTLEDSDLAGLGWNRGNWYFLKALSDSKMQPEFKNSSLNNPNSSFIVWLLFIIWLLHLL